MKVYMGTGSDDSLSMPTSVVMDLMRNYLEKGHILYIGNFHSSLDLATMLLLRNTYFVGTVTPNWAWFPHQKFIPNKI